MFRQIAAVQPLFLSLVLAWAGGYKLTARAARGLPRSTMARLVGADRARPAYRAVGTAELVVAALLVLPPAAAVEGWLAVGLTAGFVAYLGYGRIAAPDTTCGCLSAQAGPVTWAGIARAGLLLAAALAAVAADTFWFAAVAARPAVAATVLGVELGLFLGLSPELRLPARRTVGRARAWLLPHPLATPATAAPAAAVPALYRSPAYCANSGLLRSDVQDAWHAGDWTLVSYAGQVDDRPVTVVFAIPRDGAPDQVRMSIVDDVLISA